MDKKKPDHEMEEKKTCINFILNIVAALLVLRFAYFGVHFLVIYNVQHYPFLKRYHCTIHIFNNRQNKVGKKKSFFVHFNRQITRKQINGRRTWEIPRKYHHFGNKKSVEIVKNSLLLLCFFSLYS